MQSILPAVILICVVDSFLSHLSLYLYLSALLGPQMRWKKLWMVFPILVLVATGTNLAQLFAVEYIYIAYFLSSIVIYLVNLLIVWLMWERRLSRASICLTIAAILQVGTVTMLFTFLGEMGTDASDLVQYYSYMFIGYPGLTLLFRFLLNKAHLPQRIRVLMDRTKKPVRMAFCVLGLENADLLFQDVFYRRADADDRNFICFGLLFPESRVGGQASGPGGSAVSASPVCAELGADSAGDAGFSSRLQKFDVRFVCVRQRRRSGPGAGDAEKHDRIFRRKGGRGYPPYDSVGKYPDSGVKGSGSNQIDGDAGTGDFLQSGGAVSGKPH